MTNDALCEQRDAALEQVSAREQLLELGKSRASWDEPKWKAEYDAALAKLAHNKCNSGHETLPLTLWDCPACTDIVRAELAAVKAQLWKYECPESVRGAELASAIAIGKEAEITRLRERLEKTQLALADADVSQKAALVQMREIRPILKRAVSLCNLAVRVKEATFDDPDDAARWGEAINAWEASK